MTSVTVEMMVERYFVFERTDRKGNFLYNAALPTAYINAFMQMPGSVSKLPHVNAINTAPMVAENGAIIEGFGLDRDSSIFHHIEPRLHDCLPKDDITEDDVRKAARWLCDKWLIDVLTGMTGKMVVISLALTLIQRLLLAVRPAFLISAGLRGGGKTTLCHMLMMAVFGRMAAAASWSELQEERRKSLFAHFRQGVASLVWDNIKNGAEISCPEVEKALTSPTIQDRILGVSQGAAVPASTVQIFVGNNIKFTGDMASRGPEIRLLTDDPNPEDRAVAHADPIAWTRDHRAEILRCLYTIMIYGCRNRPEGQVAKTRFKTWWSLAGWPAELAASLIGVELNFDTVFKATEAQDNKSGGIVTALHLLKNTLGEKWFRARDIRTILDKGELARATFLRTGVNNEAAIRAAAAFLEMVEELTGKRNRNPITKVIGKTLAGITDRPVNLDDTTRGILRTRFLHGNNEFSVEIHQRGPDGKYYWIPGAERSGSDPSDHPSTQKRRISTIRWLKVDQVGHPEVARRRKTKNIHSSNRSRKSSSVGTKQQRRHSRKEKNSMKLGSPHDDPEARADGVARQRLSLAPLSLVWAIGPDTAATEVVAIVDTLEDQLYAQLFEVLGYQAQTSDAHSVT
jgi:hypothetical protein